MNLTFFDRIVNTNPYANLTGFQSFNIKFEQEEEENNREEDDERDQTDEENFL